MTTFTIQEHSNAKGFDVSFKTGSAAIPDQESGYIVSSGCGSGKTQSIKDLIKKKFEQGILYCVDTKSEANEMHKWVLKELVGFTSLRIEDVILLHGDNKNELREYKHNPELLMQKKVIILTHVRFWTDIINYFLIYRPKQEVPLFLGDFKTLMQREDLRQYVIFDETPLFLKPFFSIPSVMMGGFEEEKDGKCQCKSLEGIYSYYDKHVKDRAYDMFKGTDKLTRIKKETVFNCIPKYYDYWMALKNPERYSLNFYPKDLVQLGMKTHVLVYEGSGDILLSTSKAFTLIDIPKKYNSKVNFIPFEFNQERDDKKFQETEAFDTYIAGLATMIRKHTRTLVVVWKHLGAMKDDEGCGKSAYTKLVEEKLKAKGVDKELFEVIYYGSSDTKSTNKFRNCDAMILCGDWLIPTFKMEQINEAYEANICSEDYKLWYWSQLISRIGLRNHDGGTYNVYYSDDYDPSFIQKLDAYFNLNQFSHIEETEACNDWKQKLKDKTNFRKNHKQDIMSLGEYDKHIADAIMYGNEYELKISLKEISKIVVRKGKRDWDSYKTLIEKLALLKIRVIKG